MKIQHETITLPHGSGTADRWRRQYIKKHGLRYIGGGAFACAYVKDAKTSREITKIGVCDESFREDAYCAYLQQIVLKYQNNPLVPKVRSVRFVTLKYFEEKDDRYPEVVRLYIVKMERLQKWSKVRAREQLRDLLWPYGMQDETDLCYDDLMNAARRDMTGHLRQIAAKLKRIYRTYGEDIHDGNVMWRMKRGKKPQLVIIDPAA